MSVSVLLIEDNEPNLNGKKRLLKLYGCGPVVGVSNPDSAIHAMRTLPHFDLVIADIDLSLSSPGKKEHDKGGIAVARWLKESAYPAYIAGYSGHFADDDISESERMVFDDMVDRSMDGVQLEARFKQWIASAATSDRRSRLEDLVVEAYASTAASGVRVVSPIVSLDGMIGYDDDEVGQIRETGYELSLLLPKVNGQIRKAIPIWLKKHDQGCNLEVVGQPYLYSDGIDEITAKENLVQLILGYHADLEGLDPKKDMGPYVRMLSNFVNALFR